jgi:hypothetical protein
MLQATPKFDFENSCNNLEVLLAQLCESLVKEIREVVHKLNDNFDDIEFLTEDIEGIEYLGENQLHIEKIVIKNNDVFYQLFGGSEIHDLINLDVDVLFCLLKLLIAQLPEDDKSRKFTKQEIIYRAVRRENTYY